jgi:hypothetical protein
MMGLRVILVGALFLLIAALFVAPLFKPLHPHVVVVDYGVAH